MICWYSVLGMVGADYVGVGGISCLYSPRYLSHGQWVKLLCAKVGRLKQKREGVVHTVATTMPMSVRCW